MKASVHQCDVLCSLAETVCADLDDSHLTLEPVAGGKTAGWLVGHMAVTGDFARRLCGQRPICPTTWRPLFSPGSTPSTSPNAYPSMSELRAALQAVYRDLRVAALAAPESQLAIENPYAPARAAFPTAGEFVEYMLTGHLAYHIGQLVAWRAAAGLGRLPGGGMFAA